MTQDADPNRDHPSEPAPPESLFEALLADDGDDPVRHLELRTHGHGDLVGPFVVRASTLERFRTALPANAHGLRVHLVADAQDARDGLAVLREARNGLFDDDRVEIVGVQLALPAAARPAEAADTLLDALDFTAPAWIQVRPVAGWQDALAVIRQDGTENVAVDVATDPVSLAAFLGRCVELGLAFRGTGRPADPLSVLRLLSAVRATLAGAGTDEVAAVLASPDVAAAMSVLRDTGAAQAAAVRKVLASVDAQDVEALGADLRRRGLLV